MTARTRTSRGSDVSDILESRPSESLLREARAFPLLNAHEERELAQRIERGDSEALEKLVRSNLRLLLSIAANYQGHGVPLADLVQEGYLALRRAAERFDHRQGFKFSSYANRCITRACRIAIATQGSSVVLPPYIYDRRLAIWRAKAQLRPELAREPTPAEVSSITGIPEAQIILDRDMPSEMRSLNAPASPHPEEDDDDLIHLVSDSETPHLVDAIDRSTRRRIARELLLTLPDDEAQVLQLRFGLGTDTPLTLDDISARLGTSRIRIAAIESRALERLRPRLEHALGIHIVEGRSIHRDKSSYRRPTRGLDAQQPGVQDHVTARTLERPGR